MTTTDNPALRAAAHALASAEVHQQRTAEALTTALAERDRIDRRVANLDTERASIVARRASGEQQPEDGAKLALISADREGLAELQREADAGVAAARGPHEAATQAVAMARFQFDRIEAEVAEAALVQHAGSLDALMIETIRQLDEVGRRLDRRKPVYGPSSALVAAFRKVQAARGEL